MRWLVLFLPLLAAAQQVNDTSYVAPNGERVQRLEIVLPASIEEVWQTVSTSQGWMTFMAPNVEMELKPGGKFHSHYTYGAKIGDPGTIYNTVQAYVPLKMIALKIGLNELFPKEAREAGTLHAVMMLEPISPKETKVSEILVGFGKGSAWDTTWKFFDRGNRYTFAEMYKRFTTGPFDWKKLAEANKK